MTKENKKQIRPVLRKMEIYKTEEYKVTEMDAVRATITRLHSTTAKRWTTKKDGPVLFVTRIA